MIMNDKFLDEPLFNVEQESELKEPDVPILTDPEKWKILIVTNPDYVRCIK